MAAPSAPEALILQSPRNYAEMRMAMSLGRRLWDGPRSQEFNGTLDPAEEWYTQFGNAGPFITGSELYIRTYNGAPREEWRTRPHWFPIGAGFGFKLTIRFRFPEMDPVYNAVITVGGIEQIAADIGEPLRIIQKGSAFVGGSQIGRIYRDCAGSIDNLGLANDQNHHEVVVYWHPFAMGGAGNEKLSAYYDGVLFHETSAAGVAVQPRYVQLGMIQSTRIDAVPLGTVGSPVAILLVDYVRVEADGNGYETRVWPQWTSDNLGHDIDSALPGERFTQDDDEWAIIPPDQVSDWNVKQSREQAADTFTATIDLTDPRDPEAVPNRFKGQTWDKRIISMDARVIDDGLGYGSTGWWRLITAEIERVHRENGQIQLAGRDRPMLRLDTFIARSYLGIDAGSEASGGIEGTNIGFNIPEILGDLDAVAEIVAGGLLTGVTAVGITGPDITPQSLSSGGQSLLATFTELVDRLVLQCWREYAPSGDKRYGKLRVSGWRFGAPTDDPVWTFRGYGALGGLEDLETIALDTNAQDGTGQAFYRQNTPVQSDYLLSLESLQTVGTFPSAAFPPNDRVVDDSLAYLELAEMSPFVDWFDQDGNPMLGGVAYHRYRRENIMRRRLTLGTVNRPFLELTDVICVEDPNECEISESERWVVHGLDWSMKNRALRVTIDAVTSDWLSAILEQLQ